MRYAAALFALAFALSLCGCGARPFAGALPANASALIRRQDSETIRLILPSTVNHGVDQFYNAANVVIPPASKPRNVLFVFLPGSDGIPSQYELIVREAAMRGYHAIGLEYVNGLPVDLVCSEATDPNCWGDYRDEVLTGRNTSALIDVPRVDSIEARLYDLLRYLAKQYPNEGWGRYVTPVDPVWKAIAIGGHSQGAGDALYAAKLHPFARVCAIEGPADRGSFVKMAAWLQQPGPIGGGREYGFANKDDEMLSYPDMLQQWNALHIEGTPVNVGSHQPPYDDSHRLFTVLSGVPLYTHNVTAVDALTPIGPDGIPVFAPVWDQTCLPVSK